MTSVPSLRRGRPVWLPADRPRQRYPTLEGRCETDVAIVGGGMTGALRGLTGLPARGAIRTSGNAQFNPYTACVGVLKAARSAGAQIFERSAATRIVGRRDGVHVRTATGSIDARRVVIATGYATEHFRPLAGRFRMYDTYVLATRRLTKADRRELGLGDVMIWDTERPYHYARWTPDHRLLLGGG